MNWISFDPPLSGGDLADRKDTRPGRLLKTTKGKILLVGEVDVTDMFSGGCGCCGTSHEFTEYCDDLIWLIDVAKRKAGET